GRRQVGAPAAASRWPTLATPMLPIVRIRRKYTTNPSAVATRAFTSKAASEAEEGAEFSGASTKKQSGTSTTAAAVNVPAAAISGATVANRRPEKAPTSADSF